MEVRDLESRELDLAMTTVILVTMDKVGLDSIVGVVMGSVEEVDLENEAEVVLGKGGEV